MKKVAIFAFRGEPMCFIHVLLNALYFDEKGVEVKVILEGEATKLVPDFFKENSPLYHLFKKVWEKGLIEGICKACAQKMGTLEMAKEKNIKILEDMYGHAGIAGFLVEGYEIITL